MQELEIYIIVFCSIWPSLPRGRSLSIVRLGNLCDLGWTGLFSWNLTFWGKFPRLIEEVWFGSMTPAGNPSAKRQLGFQMLLVGLSSVADQYRSISPGEHKEGQCFFANPENHVSFHWSLY